MKLFRILGAVAVLLALSAIDVAAATVGGAPTRGASHHALNYLLGGGALGLTLATTHPTLIDLMNVLGPDDQIARIIEILNETNEILDDAVAIEGNQLTGHVTTIRTGLPQPTWRKLYGGVQPTKSTSVKVMDTCGMLEDYAEVDKALADLNGNTAAFRLSENRPHLEGFNEEIADSLFYANEDTEPECFTGLAPRFNDSSAENGVNIIKGGSADTDNTSIWLVVWGENTCHLIYPKGSKGGFQMEDKGQVTIENVDGAGGRMEAYRTHYRWDIGLTVRDWRYIVRIPNIEISALKADASSGANIIDLMTQALEQVASLNLGKPAFYCNRTIRSILRRQQVSKVAGSTLTFDQVGGKPVLSFCGVPVRRCDSLVNNEAIVT